MRTAERTEVAEKRISLGEHIVLDPRICCGKPTFKGTRIMVWQVLEDVADGKSWDFISQVRWGGRVPVAAISEAVRLAQCAFLDTQGKLHRKPRRTPARELVTA